MKHLYFWLFAFTYFISIAGNYTGVIPPGLPQSSETGMCFLNIDNDNDLEFIYSYTENNRQVTRIYQTKNGNILDVYFEIEDKFLTNITPVSFTNNDEIQFLAIEPLQNGKFKFSVHQIITNDNVLGLEEIATSFSSISFDKITYDVFDFDADGDLDIFFIGEGTPTVTEVLLNQGNYIFKNLPLELPKYTEATIAHYDFTQDGYQDVYLAGIVEKDTIGKLFKNNGGESLESFDEQTLNIPAVVNGQVIIQRFNNNNLPDIYIRGEKGNRQYSRVFELTLTTNINKKNSISVIKDLPYFENGIASIHDFNNDGVYDLFTSGYFPQENISKTQISYQEKNNNGNGLIFSSIEDLTALDSSNVSVVDINQDGRLEIITTGRTFDKILEKKVSRTMLYSNNFTENKRPNPINDIKIDTTENNIRISWNPVPDDNTNEDILFYEVDFYLSNKEKKFTGNSSTPDGIRLFPSKGITQNTFLILNNIPIGDYIVSVQAIDNGLLASKASIPKQVKITHPLDKENFDTFEIVQFRGENFENKFEIVDLNADGYKDFLVINKDKKLTYLVQKEINVFEQSPLFEEHVNKTHHFELGDYSLDGYVDIWFLEGDGIENELYIFDPQDSILHNTEIENLESFLLLDIDNDLDLDIIAESKTQNGTAFYENNDGNFKLSTFSFNEFLRPIGVYDFNKDSYPDFYFIKEDSLTQSTFLGLNRYNDVLGKNKDTLFQQKKILTTEKFKVIDGLDFRNDGDRDFLIEKKDGFAIFEKKDTNWEIIDLPLQNQFFQQNTQIRVADFDDDLRKEQWYFSIDKLQIYFPKNKKTYEFSTDILNKGNWGNTKGQKALQWIKIVDLNADGLNDLLAHVIINDKAQTYYFANNFDKNTTSIDKPNNLFAKPSVGRATLTWDENTTNQSKGEYLLEMQKVVFDGDDIDSTFLNFDAIHTIDDETSTQVDNINYLGLTNSLEINQLLEGEYTWRIATKIENRFSDWSDWNTFRINNFLKNDTLIPPVYDNNYDTLTSKFSKSADFDGDGDLDFLFIGHKNYLYINRKNQKFDTIPLNDLPIYGYADVKIINYDHDDFLDLMISGIDKSWTSPSCGIYRNNVDNQDTSFTKIVDFPPLAFGSMDQADIDNDGDLDYVVTGKNANGEFKNYFIVDKRISFAEKPDFRTTEFLIDNNSSNKVKAQFIDNDNDGFIDLFCSIYNDNSKSSNKNINGYLIVKKNQDFIIARDSLSIVINKKIKDVNKVTAPYEFIYTDFGDYNNDGYLDLILVGISPNETNNLFDNEKNYYTNTAITTKTNWTLKLYTGSENIFKIYEIPSPTLGKNRINNIKFWDIENDGDLDFFIQQTEHIVFVENDNNDFEESSQMRINGQFSFSTFGDFQGIENDSLRDTRLDFITGSLNASHQYTLSKNNIAYLNILPEKPESVTIKDPIDESTDDIFKGTGAIIEWKEGGDDENFGTEDESIQYSVSIYRNEKDVLLYNYQTHNPFLELKNLEDGEYRCEIKSIDQGAERSKLVAIDTFTIKMDPQIIGSDKTCEDQLTTYRVQPNHQDYTWKIIEKDTSYTFSSIELNSDSIRLKWNIESTVKIIVTNTNSTTKKDTIEIKVLEKPIADFTYGKEISFGAEIDFINTSKKDTDTYVWMVNEDKNTLNSTMDFSYTFENAGLNTVSLITSNEIGCIAQKDTTIDVKNNVIINTSAFVTQNNDGKNDFLYIEHLDRYSNNQITIFNQWGQELHVIENYSNNWEQIMGNEKLPIGNYFLIIDVFVNDSQTQTFKSTFSVLK